MEKAANQLFSVLGEPKGGAMKVGQALLGAGGRHPRGVMAGPTAGARRTGLRKTRRRAGRKSPPGCSTPSWAPAGRSVPLQRGQARRSSASIGQVPGGVPTGRDVP